MDTAITSGPADALRRTVRTLGANSDVLMAVGFIMILALMIVPIPPMVLDVLLATNITIAILILIVSMYITHPLELSVFPGLLLILTIFRLSLNVASTRLVLGEGYAGEVINAFGSFVVKGNYVVGFIIFLILVLIQFIVIVKGAGRIAEVAARFTLDAMPGKQMAIDADLSSGAMDADTARKRRKDLERGCAGRNRECMCVNSQKQRAVGPLFLSIEADRLSYRKYVSLIERAVEGRPAMPGGAEGNPLLRHGRVRRLCIISRDEFGHVDQHRWLRWLSCKRAYFHDFLVIACFPDPQLWPDGDGNAPRR